MYGKVIVASKVPLPNYRPDLDDKRPQREVSPCIPLARSNIFPLCKLTVFKYCECLCYAWKYAGGDSIKLTEEG
jgi:hypothetical protein